MLTPPYSSLPDVSFFAVRQFIIPHRHICFLQFTYASFFTAFTHQPQCVATPQITILTRQNCVLRLQSAPTQEMLLFTLTHASISQNGQRKPQHCHLMLFASSLHKFAPPQPIPPTNPDHHPSIMRYKSNLQHFPRLTLFLNFS